MRSRGGATSAPEPRYGRSSQPKGTYPAPDGPRRALPRLLRRYAWPHRWGYLAGAAFLLLTNVIAVSIPVQIGHAIDSLTRGELSGVWGRAAVVAVLGFAVIGVRTLSRVLIFNPARHLEHDLRRDLFHHLLSLQPVFYAERSSGDLVSRASNDLSLVRAMVGFGGLQVLNVFFAVTLTGWQMVGISPRLTAVVLVPVVLTAVLVHLGIRRLFWLQRRNQEELASLSEHVLESVRGISTIQGFGAEEAFLERFDDRNDAWLRTGVSLARIRSVLLPLLVLGGGLGIFAVVAYGGPLAIGGFLSVGDLAAFTALVAVLLPPLRSVGWMLAVVQRGQAALERIYELLDVPVESPEGRRSSRASGQGPSIVLNHLTFAYPGRQDHPVLRGIRAEIPAGSAVGLFGRTGSGKSTLLRLLARLHEPPRGTLLVDGVDLVDIDIGAWRARTTAVLQRPFLFSDTVANNVAMEGRPRAERLRRAVDAAALATDLAALPRGLETVVGERGVLLSGGQRQRISLARGLYRGGDVLLLDDILSAVDHATEASLLQSLDRFVHGDGRPTSFVASHRVSALRGCDPILVLDAGVLVDQGTHEALIRRPGIYRDAWRFQAGEGSPP